MQSRRRWLFLVAPVVAALVILVAWWYWFPGRAFDPFAWRDEAQVRNGIRLAMMRPAIVAVWLTAICLGCGGRESGQDKVTEKAGGPKPAGGKAVPSVLFPSAYNGRVGLALLCPITSQVKGYPFEVPLPEGLPVTGVVGADQVKSLDWRARKASRIGAIPGEVVAQVVRRLQTLLEDDG